MLNAPFDYTGKMMSGRERFQENTVQTDWLRPLGKGHINNDGMVGGFSE